MSNDDAASLAYQLAHELKAPLMGIKGLSATATRMYDQLTDAERHEFFELIEQEATRLARVADQAAALWLLELGTLPYSFSQASLDDLIEETVGGHDRVQVAVDGPPITLSCDEKRVLEILAALTDNAERYSDGSIEFQTRTEGPFAQVVVVDVGPGIPADRFEAAFDRFTTVRPKGYEGEPGAGLSLYLARAHAAAHGGTLVMEAADPTGTMLTLTLPLEPTT